MNILKLHADLLECAKGKDQAEIEENLNKWWKQHVAFYEQTRKTSRLMPESVKDKGSYKEHASKQCAVNIGIEMLKTGAIDQVTTTDEYGDSILFSIYTLVENWPEIVKQVNNENRQR